MPPFVAGLKSLRKSPSDLRDIPLDGESLDRLVTWMDTYAHRQGFFSPDQEKQLVALRDRYLHLFEE